MKNILVNYINKNKTDLLIIIVLFFVGIAIGIIFINNTEDIQKNDIRNYIDNLICNAKNYANIDKTQLLSISVKNNLLFIIIIWFLGCTIIGGPIIYLAIIYKGISIGYTISALIAVLGVKTGTIITILALALQNIIYLPIVFVIAENGVKLYKGLYKRCINIKEELIKHTIIMSASLVITFLSSLVEVYCSTNLLILFISKVLV